jgi:hypothetical protein
MHRKKILLFITLIYFVSVKAQWTVVGDIMKPSYYVSLAFNKNNIPFVLYGEGSSMATVKKYENSSWQAVGDAQFSNNYVFSPVLAIANNDTLYTAFSEWRQGHQGQVSVMKFNGTSWVYVGNRFITPNVSAFVSLATDTAGLPYIAFRDEGDLNKLSVMKFNSGAWEYVGTRSFSPRSAGYVSLAFNKLNKPYVAFKDSLNKASVMMFDGASWALVGPIGFSEGAVYRNTSLAIDSNNVPYVAYTDVANGNKATVMKFDGTQWINAGAAAFSSTVAYDVHLAINWSNIPYVGYKNSVYDADATVMKLESETWNVVGTEAFTPRRFESLSLAFNKYGTPHVATDSGSVRLMKYVNPPYTFIGSGEWNVAANWSNNVIPPNPLPGDFLIVINPAAGECILNGTIILSAGSMITVMPGKVFTVNGNVIVL